MTRISKLLVANRGEIACRIMSTCRRMGIRTVAVYSQVDEQAAHVSMADEAVAVGPAAARDSYLRADKIIAAAIETGAQAVHPGYGFLAESPAFAQAVIDAGLIWIGPSPETIANMGDKDRARGLAQAAGTPILPGSRRFAAGSLDGLAEAASDIGFPLLVKAACGGGGIGMRRIDEPTELVTIAAATQSMAERSFGDGTIYLERFVARARHVEVQVFGFGDGTAVHLFDRDCSVQRRYQKVIEEAPAPCLPAGVRAGMQSAAVKLAASVSYAGAGTVEFIYDVERNEFYFLEMNTRIQVEHPVTEMITGVDLVEWQIVQAAGTLVPQPQLETELGPHSIEVRLYAERPEKNFLPSPGTVTELVWPHADDTLRIDHAIRKGDRITPYYDPMIAKLVARGSDRQAAIERLKMALDDIRIEGVPTNVAFLKTVLGSTAFREADLSTDLIARLNY